MGLPMIPKPMKPTFSAILSLLLEPEISDAHVAAAQTFGYPREALLRPLGRGVVFQSHVAVVAELLEDAEDVRVVNLPRARLPSPRRVSHLHVPYLPNVPPQGDGQVPLHPLHVVEVVLELDVRLPDARHERRRIIGP